MLSVIVNAYERDPISPKAMHQLLWLCLSGMMDSMEWFLLEVSASTSQNEDEQ